VERAKNIYYNWNGRVGKYSKMECYLEALKRDPEYAEAWCGLGSEITGMSDSEDTDKELAGMDLFKDEPKITDEIGKLHIVHINAAVFCFDKAIEIEPKNVEAWFGKGVWYNTWLNHELYHNPFPNQASTFFGSISIALSKQNTAALMWTMCNLPISSVIFGSSLNKSMPANSLSVSSLSDIPVISDPNPHHASAYSGSRFSASR
jgi:hypothetical protein